MPVTLQQRRFNNYRGFARTTAEASDTKMQREAQHGQRVQQRLARESQRLPVTNPSSTQTLPADFVAECLAMIKIHLANGHFDQAAQTVASCAERWELRRLFDQDSTPSEDYSACHVNLLFDARTANLIESLCSGTVGALLEIFPAKFIGCPNAGTVTVKNIARHLVRVGAITAEDAQSRVNEYATAMQTRNKVAIAKYPSRTP